ncbi:hypothetical protein SCUP234_13073 [Seiridium cupressi]
MPAVGFSTISAVQRLLHIFPERFSTSNDEDALGLNYGIGDWLRAITLALYYIDRRNGFGIPRDQNRHSSGSKKAAAIAQLAFCPDDLARPDFAKFGGFISTFYGSSAAFTVLS